MNNLIDELMNAARKFTLIDFAILKICLLSMGVLLGVYLSDFFMRDISIVWMIAVVTLFVLLVQVIRYCWKNKSE